jgi:hypothetical protein
MADTADAGAGGSLFESTKASKLHLNTIWAPALVLAHAAKQHCNMMRLLFAVAA